MTNCDTYINFVGRYYNLVKEGKSESDEAQKILRATEELWGKLTEEEQCYADEQTIRIQQWIGA